MKKTFFWFQILVVMSSLGSPSHAQDEGSTFVSTLIAKLEKAAGNTEEAPSVSVGLIHRGEVVWVQSFGLSDLENGDKATVDTYYQLGSISKTYTAWAVMKLVELGDIELDAPVNDYLERWQVSGNEDVPQSEVTVRRLLAHQGGLGVQGYNGIPFDGETPPELPSLVESLRGESTTPEVAIESRPGGKMRYSGGGYTVLQLLIEDVTGVSFSQFLKEEILAPLSLQRTHFGWNDEVASSVATPYDRERKPFQHHLFTELAAAGVYATIGDLASFGAAVMSSELGPAGRSVLEPETVSTMTQQQSEGDRGRRYGLGYTLSNLGGGRRVCGHNGSNFGWKSMLRVLPDHGEGIALVANSDDVGVAGRLFQTWSREVAAYLDAQR